MGQLLSAVGNLENLHRAWTDVRSHVRRTSWPHLLVELERVEARPIQTLRRIQRDLRAGAYVFAPKQAYAKRKSGGSRRGITVHGIADRIVQRAILNIVQSPSSAIQKLLGEVPRVLQTSTSFAGTPGRGVPQAIELARQAIRNGAGAFAYSDMKDFFPCVPREEVVAFLKTNIVDEEFVALFAAALETELADAVELQPWLELFPLSETGVAQGALLSTLVGNLSLRSFDERLNDGRLVTVRYLDDFVILGPDLQAVTAGFQRAQEELTRLEMRCYEPNDGSHKAALGLVAGGFDFLGCRIHPDGVSPSRKTGRKLLLDLNVQIAAGKRQMRQFAAAQQRRRTEAAYAQTLVQIDKKIRGWGDAYRFVSNRLPFAQLDAAIDRMLHAFRAWYQRLDQEADGHARRRIQGVALLSDTPPTRRDQEVP